MLLGVHKELSRMRSERYLLYLVKKVSNYLKWAVEHLQLIGNSDNI
jgi:hypothetical protein